MDVWCIEMQYINYLLHQNRDADIYDIQKMVEECISNNGLFRCHLNNFFDFNKELYYKNCVEVLYNYQKKFPDVLKRIKHIVMTCYKTWDNYALSIMYLKQYDLVLKRVPKNLPPFHKEFITNILWKNVQPNPTLRLSINTTKIEFQKLKNGLKSSEFLKIAKYA